MKKITFLLKAILFSFFILISIHLNAQSVLDGDKCVNDGYDSFELAQDPAGDVSSSSSDITDLFATIAGDYLYLSMERLGAGTAAFAIYLDVDCDVDPLNGDQTPGREGSDIALFFKWSGNGTISPITIYEYIGGIYVDSSEDFEAFSGTPSCIVNSDENQFIELKILIDDFKDPLICCNTIKIKNAETYPAQLTQTPVDIIDVGFELTVSGAIAGPDQNECSGTDFQLAANDPTPGTGAWTVSGPSSDTNQFDSLTSNTAIFTPAGGLGDYVLTWTMTDGICITFDDVTLTINECSLSVAKSSTTTSITAPGLITYSYLVTNTGNETLTN
ncbi:MAG: hypothetical protein COB81_11200, partial [Flavobacteriaceae bacterium]